MSYGEYGGNRSVQKSLWLAEPDVRVTRLTPGAEAWANLGEDQLSNRARTFLREIERDDLTFYGKDNTPAAGLGNFKVRVHFQDEAEIAKAANAFREAVGAKQVQVEFSLRVVKDSPGQIRIAWGPQADLNLGDDSTLWNGTPGGGTRYRRGLAGLWQGFLRIFRIFR